MSNPFRRLVVVASCLPPLSALALTYEPNEPLPEARTAKAAIIICRGMIDDGLAKSIERRTAIALAEEADYLIYEIDTYGGMVQSAVDISDDLIELGREAHTVVYINTKAISAGAMISVSCQDIIMRDSATIGDCAPVMLGGKLEGVEREKIESFIRGIFERAAETNGYPAAVLKAMVTMQTEVYRVQNLEKSREEGKQVFEFFETDDVPKDPNRYDLENKVLEVSSDELVTLTASKAFEWGVARALVQDRAGVLEFLAKRDGVTFAEPPIVLRTTWSEEMVRKINHPAVMGVLFMIALLGVYVELNTPGLGLPGLVAVICFTVMIGSKYLVGMANWVEVALFVVGLILLMVEIFVLPGFGIAGLLGIVCLLFGLFGMLVKNPPGSFPWPDGPQSWDLFIDGI
ncbi:MAG: NfeD family protein, partial [Planctomycetota bacterium]